MPEWKIGDRIENRYEIHQILRGGMGVVYEAEDTKFKCHCHQIFTFRVNS